jgi:hypothetical protein
MASQRTVPDARVKVALSCEERLAIKEELASTGGYGVSAYIQQVIRQHLESLGYLGAGKRSVKR